MTQSKEPLKPEPELKFDEPIIVTQEILTSLHNRLVFLKLAFSFRSSETISLKTSKITFKDDEAIANAKAKVNL
jgi:hypothetical protein